MTNRKDFEEGWIEGFLAGIFFGSVVTIAILNIITLILGL